MAEPKVTIIPPDAELVDVVDEADRPIGVLPLAEVHRQGLYHRSVRVAVFDHAGRVYLQKRSKAKELYPGRLDLSATGHVRAGESREAAALRELQEELGIAAERLRHVADVAGSPDTNFEFITLYTAGRLDALPRPNPDEVESGFFADRSELDYLMANYRDQLTPGLVHSLEKGLLFPVEGL
ncbi:MAG: NUDIX domain-containing protein [Thermodesulfobacteriota bacterium]